MLFVGCGEEVKERSEREVSESGGSHEDVAPSLDSLIDEFFLEMDGFVKAMTSMTDVTSAEIAVIEIKRRADAILVIAKKVEAFPIPSEDEKARLTAKWQEYEKGLQQLSRPDRSKMTDSKEVGRIMGRGMQSVGKTLEEADVILRKYGIQLVRTK